MRVDDGDWRRHRRHTADGPSTVDGPSWARADGRRGPSRAGQKASDAATTTMVTPMAATLLIVVAPRVAELGDNLADVAAVVPFHAAALVAVAFAGKAVARLFRLDAPAGRAIVFTVRPATPSSSCIWLWPCRVTWPSPLSLWSPRLRSRPSA